MENPRGLAPFSSDNNGASDYYGAENMGFYWKGASKGHRDSNIISTLGNYAHADKWRTRVFAALKAGWSYTVVRTELQAQFTRSQATARTDEQKEALRQALRQEVEAAKQAQVPPGG